MEERINKSGDNELLKDVALWKDLKEQLIIASPNDNFFSDKVINDIEALKDEIHDLETEIARRSAIFRQEQAIDDAKWEDVQSVLLHNEAAVEMIRFEEISDVYGNPTVHYAVAVLTAQKEPEIVFLNDGNGIESVSYKVYNDWINAMEAGEFSLEYFQMEEKWGGPGFPDMHKLSYKSFRESIESIIPDEVDTIFLSTDGVYSFVNLDIISDDNLKSRNIKLVTSTRRLIEERKISETTINQPQSAVLMGGPIFSTISNSETSMKPYKSILYRGETLLRLPGTDEVKKIGKTLYEAGAAIEIYTGLSASEENIKSLANTPTILHLATHGFFFSDMSSDPLNNGGIYLSGAQDSIDYGGILPDREEDGFLTGREVSLLDLTGTELVVLSACETGLGDPRSGEGVYGLFRGFQAAGVTTLIVSRWKVSDDATAIFMYKFYETWSLGTSIHSAFDIAKKELQSNPKYNSSFYWGAFVLIDAID